MALVSTVVDQHLKRSITLSFLRFALLQDLRCLLSGLLSIGRKVQSPLETEENKQLAFKNVSIEKEKIPFSTTFPTGVIT